MQHLVNFTLINQTVFIAFSAAATATIDSGVTNSIWSQFSFSELTRTNFSDLKVAEWIASTFDWHC